MLNRKTVYIAEPEIFRFLYPSYYWTDQHSMVEQRRGMICKIKPGDKIHEAKMSMSLLYDKYIILAPHPSSECDFTYIDRVSILHLISQVRRIRFAKNLVKPVMDLQDIDFLRFIKMSVAKKSWYREMFLKEGQMYRLFKALVSSRSEFSKEYFQIIATNDYTKVFSSVLTFLSRIETYEDQRELLGDYYRDIVRKGKGQKLNIRKAVGGLLGLSPTIPDEIRYFYFLQLLTE